MAARLFLRLANAIFNVILIISLLGSGTYAVYALWDNNQVLSAAGDVQADMIKLKPKIEPEVEDNSASFEELLAINPDVVGWISMDNTHIDFPILQGSSNFDYINTDVYGNFALAGSIFLDSRNKRDFSEDYSLLYGHHMANGNMFGDLDLYKDEAFFRENRTGALILPEKTYHLEIICCMLVGASDEYIFEPQNTQYHINGLLKYVAKEAMYINQDVLQRTSETKDVQILALSTCSSEYTDARTIVLAVMDPYTAGGTGGEQNDQ